MSAALDAHWTQADGGMVGRGAGCTHVSLESFVMEGFDAEALHMRGFCWHRTVLLLVDSLPRCPRHLGPAVTTGVAACGSSADAAALFGLRSAVPCRHRVLEGRRDGLELLLPLGGGKEDRPVPCDSGRRQPPDERVPDVRTDLAPVVKGHQPLEYEVYMEKLIYLEKLQELATMSSRTTALLCATLSVPVEIAAGMGLSVPVVVNKISKGQGPAKPSIFHPSADFVRLKQHAPLVLKRSRRRVIGEPVTVAVKAVISAMAPPIQDARRELRALGALGGSFRTALVGADQPLCEAVGAKLRAAQALAALNDTWQPPPVKDSPEALMRRCRLLYPCQLGIIPDEGLDAEVFPGELVRPRRRRWRLERRRLLSGDSVAIRAPACYRGEGFP
ncbi:unnamed protein product [Durusdinium trenchii]|uniref:Uncharacterized protein n=1 Tax=Durusdinium trenchii TaxID=1381693 RepID=A0ABP0RMQ4_9DINO